MCRCFLLTSEVGPWQGGQVARLWPYDLRRPSSLCCRAAEFRMSYEADKAKYKTPCRTLLRSRIECLSSLASSLF